MADQQKNSLFLKVKSILLKCKLSNYVYIVINRANYSHIDPLFFNDLFIIASENGP